MSTSIYIIEDEKDIAELMRYNLSLRQYAVTAFGSAEDGFRGMDAGLPDLIILDIMLPGLNGLDTCKRLKSIEATKNIPIIMVSAKGEEEDIVKGLELGADDYVTKPFSLTVLNARVDAVLRRKKTSKPDIGIQTRIHDIEIFHEKIEVYISGNKIDLTQSEFKILQFLASRPGWVYTRNQIVEAIRGDNYSVTDRTIDFQMVGLRKKLGEKGDVIETVRGVGYRFKE